MELERVISTSSPNTNESISLGVEEVAAVKVLPTRYIIEVDGEEAGWYEEF